VFLLAVLSFSSVFLWPHSAALAQSTTQASGFNPQALLQNALEWVNQLGPTGAIAFIAIYAAATVAFFPGSILTLGAGVLFGAGLGSLYVFVGATLGATAARLLVIPSFMPLMQQWAVRDSKLFCSPGFRLFFLSTY
jgi:uncharacterized membrane protein YdjX (TVP38/TMEM64 family)